MTHTDELELEKLEKGINDNIIHIIMKREKKYATESFGHTNSNADVLERLKSKNCKKYSQDQD